MASRQETARRRQELSDHLKRITTDGSVRPGGRLPSLRQLSAEFDLSMPIVSKVLQPLVDQQVVRSIRGQGLVLAELDSTDLTFVFLRTESASSDQEVRARFGFERGCAELGATCLVMAPTQLLAVLDPHVRDSGAGLRCDGVFSWGRIDPSLSAMLAEQAVPAVASRYAERDPAVQHDLIGFHDVDGGRKAAMHLLRRGLSRTAFVGFHRDSDIGLKRIWSREREQGWAEVLPGGRTFLVPTVSSRQTAAESAACVAAQVVPALAEFDALVAADDIVAGGIVDRLQADRIEAQDWPALVSFETLPDVAQHVWTSVCPDRELVGLQASRLLHDRATGRHHGPPREELVDMTVLTRMSSHPSWAVDAKTWGLIPQVA